MSLSDMLVTDLLSAISSAREELARARELEAQPGLIYTEEEIKARKEFLHRQLAWLARRDEAERIGQEFGEEQPCYH